MSTETSLVSAGPRAPVVVGSNGLQLANLDDMFRFSNAVSKSGLAPRGMESPEAIFVAIQLGAELGLTPMAALQNIGIINGRPGIYGDAALALVRSSPHLESYSQRLEGEGDSRRAVVISKRKGGEQIESSFSVADAKKAGLWGKQGPWTQYPDRMLLFRARGFNLRDNFGDILKGLKTSEELRDYATNGGEDDREINVTPSTPEQEAAAAVRSTRPTRRTGVAAAKPVEPAATEPEKPAAAVEMAVAQGVATAKELIAEKPAAKVSEKKLESAPAAKKEEAPAPAAAKGKAPATRKFPCKGVGDVEFVRRGPNKAGVIIRVSKFYPEGTDEPLTCYTYDEKVPLPDERQRMEVTLDETPQPAPKPPALFITAAKAVEVDQDVPAF